VVKEFRDGRKIELDVYTTVELYPILLLGGGDTEWVSCAIGKENMAGQHCNHCHQSTKDFIQGLGEPWTIEKIKTAADHYQNRLLPAAAHRATQPAGYLGVKTHPMYPIPIHLWGCLILHDELGLAVKDWLTRLENFAECRVEIISADEVATREHLVIRTNDLEDLLVEGNELQPKESIKNLEKHLARIKKEIHERAKLSVNPKTRIPTIIPGHVTPEEQLIVYQISWDITSWYATTKQLFEETKSAKEEIEKKRKTLKNLKDTRDLTDESVEYAIDCTLCLNGVDQKVYHGQCLIGPQIQKQLANRVQIIYQLETEFLRVREQNSIKNPTTNLALIEEIKEEMNFFRVILHCYDCAFGLLRRTRKKFTPEEISELQGAIDPLKTLWPTQRSWEKKAASVTPKPHNLWFEVPEQLTYLGRFYHFMEDPIKKLHKIDRLMDAVYSHLRDYEVWEESKRKQVAIGKHYAVKLQSQQVTQSHKRKFAEKTLLKREDKKGILTIIKKEHRSLLSTD
jgi:hypothetical protein